MVRIPIFAALALVFGLSTADAAMHFRSVLSGDQEVPSTGLPQGGVADYTLRIGGVLGPALEFDLLFDNLFNFNGHFDVDGSTGTQIVTRLHIHEAPRGVNGPIVFGIIEPNSDTHSDVTATLNADGTTRITGVWNSDEGVGTTFADLVSVFASAAPGDELPFYLNLHTTEFPGGAIRGQIQAVPLPAGLALLLSGLGVLALIRRRAQEPAVSG